MNTPEQVKKVAAGVPESNKLSNDSNSLDAKQKDRNYDPINEAKRGNIAQELNADSARYRTGPAPV